MSNNFKKQLFKNMITGDLQKPVLFNKKIKVLAYCDSPTCATGFGTVSRNILEAIHKTGNYDIDVFGINYWGTPHQFPYNIWPAGTNKENDPYGRQKFVTFALQHDFDILFILQDTFITTFTPQLIQALQQRRAGKPFKVIMYYPIDGTPKPAWLNSIYNADKIVAYSDFGRDMVYKVWDINGVSNKPNIDMVPHGANTKDFFPINNPGQVTSFRKEYFGKNAGKFIFTNVNRNQQRKDIPRTISAFAEFKKLHPNSLLYLHMAVQDQGGDQSEVAKAFGLKINEDVVFPKDFEPNQGYPVSLLNFIYNASDCVISTTLGEGAGLAWLEAMATKTPVIMPNNTAITEFITEDRGYLVDSGTSANLKIVLVNDLEVIRPLVDIDHMVKIMGHVVNNYEEAKTKAEVAYRWIVKDMDWQGSIAKRWVEIFNHEVNKIILGNTHNINKAVINSELI